MSASGSKCSAISTIETSTSKAEKILAHSIPIAPEPIITILFGNFFKSKISSELKTNSWSKSIFFNPLGEDPVAVIIFLHSKSSPSAEILFSSIILASALIVLTPLFFKESSRLFLNFSTILSLRSTTFS